MPITNSNAQPPAWGGVPVQQQEVQAPERPSFLRDMCDGAETAAPALFREREVSDLMAVLSQSAKPNALLVGPAGCGKTKVVEELARLIAVADPRVPPKVARCRVFELPLASMASGASYVGMVEQRVEELVDWAGDPANHAVVFVDEAHQLVSGDPTMEKVAQALKPALARGSMRMVCATTTQEAKRLDADPAFSRRFSRVNVAELTPEQTLSVLEAAAGRLERHYDWAVSIDRADLAAFVAAADRMAGPGMHRPDGALTLLDRACAASVVERQARAAACDDPCIAAVIGSSPMPVCEVQAARAAEELWGAPAAPATSIAEALSPIVAQDRAVAEVAEAVEEAQDGLFAEDGPLVLMLAGPTGSGKTECARLLSRALFGTEPVKLNMAEYHSSASINRIIGSPLGYVGSDTAQELPLDALATDPRRLVLLDEFEKADRSVQRLFLSAFDTGSMDTAKGRPIDLSRAVVVCTSNAGAERLSYRPCGFGAAATRSETSVKEALSADFDPEMIARFGRVIAFDDIDAEAFPKVVAAAWEREAARAKERRPGLDVPDAIGPEEAERIAEEAYVPGLGARPAVKAVRSRIRRLARTPRQPAAAPAEALAAEQGGPDAR